MAAGAGPRAAHRRLPTGDVAYDSHFAYQEAGHTNFIRVY